MTIFETDDSRLAVAEARRQKATVYALIGSNLLTVTTRGEVQTVPPHLNKEIRAKITNGEYSVRRLP